MTTFGVPYRGFTIIELAVVILIIGVLATIGVVTYNGIQERAINNTMLSDLEHASTIVESYALQNGGTFPDDGYLQQTLDSSPDVHVSIVVKGGVSGQTETAEPELPRYVNLSPVQNAVLFRKMCTELSQEERPDAPGLKYGQGKNSAGGTITYMWGPNFCNVYNKGNIQFNSSRQQAGGDLAAPVTEAIVQNHINAVTLSDPYFPDFVHVVKQYYQTVRDRFVQQGGTFPITTFWDGTWCQTGQSWCTAYEALPELPDTSESGSPLGGGSSTNPEQSASTQSYCILAVNTKRPDTVFSFSSEVLASKSGNCSDT